MFGADLLAIQTSPGDLNVPLGELRPGNAAAFKRLEACGWSVGCTLSTTVIH